MDYNVCDEGPSQCTWFIKNWIEDCFCYSLYSMLPGTEGMKQIYTPLKSIKI